MKRKIKNWMRTQNYEDYFTDGIIEQDWAMYTQLGEDCSATLGFKEGSEADQLCFEIAVDELDRYAS